MAFSGAYEYSPGRVAAAEAAAQLVEPDTIIGLGSGRAVWSAMEALGARWPGRSRIRAVVASDATYALAHAAGIDVIQPDGTFELDLVIDGADEIDPELRLLKGGGGALLREKIVASAARRLVIVAESSKLVTRLGEGFRLPVEVVRFGWRDTVRRLRPVLPETELRRIGDEPFITDEFHYVLDCEIPEGTDPEALERTLDHIPGVVEHGLFIDMVERVIVGKPDGSVETLGALE